jgi:hypothetical protein
MFYFYPWGEKDYTNLVDCQYTLDQINSTNGLSNIYAEKFVPQHLHTDIKIVRVFQPVLFCHDQEPLNFDLYQDDGDAMKKFQTNHLEKLPYPVPNQNLRACHHWSFCERWILLHTEKNSTELDRYEKTGRYIGAFWWSHALIARDWYRYAEFDKSLENTSARQKLFLVYARDFTGTRQYRQGFIESIENLSDHCQVGSVNTTDPGPTASAIYSSNDFSNTNISVVLETLFEDSRIYLTEKILRPIACGHPFILAAGPHSLDFLKNYGFETFAPWIDESYDLEPDHATRMKMIVKEMNRIACMPELERKQLIESCQEIARRNKQRFFSSSFLDQVVKELETNVSSAYEYTKNRFCVNFYWNTRKWRKKQGIETLPEFRDFFIPFIRRCRNNKGLLE